MESNFNDKSKTNIENEIETMLDKLMEDEENEISYLSKNETKTEEDYTSSPKNLHTLEEILLINKTIFDKKDENASIPGNFPLFDSHEKSKRLSFNKNTLQDIPFKEASRCNSGNALRPNADFMNQGLTMIDKNNKLLSIQPIVSSRSSNSPLNASNDSGNCSNLLFSKRNLAEENYSIILI